MQVYEVFDWYFSKGDAEYKIRTDKFLGLSEGSFYGFYNSRGAGVSTAQPCWRGYKCFRYTSYSRPYRMGSNVRSVTGKNGEFDIIEVFEGDSDKPQYFVARFYGSAKRIDSNLFAVRL